MAIPDVLSAAHQFVEARVRAGETVVDATLGNGHDTAFLAETVGATGRVYGFDVQAAAVESTRERLETKELIDRVTLHEAGHERLQDLLPETVQGEVAAVMFNLGYLPGGETDCITAPETTIPALKAAVEVLRPGGVLTVVLYTGHEGGAREAQLVRDWASEQPQDQLQVLSYTFLNQKNDPPQLLVGQKVEPEPS